MTWRTMLASAVVAALVTVSPAAAAMQCGPAEPILKQLQDQYGEVPAFTGNANGVMIMVTVGPSGTWSVIGERNGQICLIASGDKWMAKPVDKIAPAPQSLPTPAKLPHGIWRI